MSPKKLSLLILLVIVPLAFCGRAASAADISGLNTPDGGASVGNVISEISPNENWQAYGKLCFRARLTKKHREGVWLHVRLTGINGWSYVATNACMLIGTCWRDIEIDLSETSPSWSFAGHRRPYDRFVLNKISFVSLESSMTEACPGRVVITSASLLPKSESWWFKNRRVVEMEAPFGEAHVGALSRVRFRLYPSPEDPFDTSLKIMGIFRAPSDRRFEVPAFYGQDFERRSARLIPSGPGYWALRFRPDEPGKHSLTIRGGGDIPFETGEIVFEVEPEAPQERSLARSRRPLVDGGVSEGAPTWAAVQQLHARGFERVRLATPVASPFHAARLAEYEKVVWKVSQAFGLEKAIDSSQYLPGNVWDADDLGETLLARLPAAASEKLSKDLLEAWR